MIRLEGWCMEEKMAKAGMDGESLARRLFPDPTESCAQFGQLNDSQGEK